MSLHFLTPVGALVIAAGIIPLVLAGIVERRNARARGVLGLPAPTGPALFALPVAFALLAIVLGLAAAQPVLRTDRNRLVRTDAEVFLAVDTSRSMGASTTATSPRRIDRARTIGDRLRAALPDVPMGLGTFTDRPLPTMFPTNDLKAFTAAVHESLGLEEPPGLATGKAISSYDAVAPFPLDGYFSPTAKRRVLVVVTDTESSSFNEAGVRESFKARPRTAVVLIRVGSAGERLFGPDGVPDPEYVAPAGSSETLTEFLSATRGKAFGEGDVTGAVAAARADLGDGPRARLGTVSDRRALAPWLVLAGVLPLGVVLRRRNL